MNRLLKTFTLSLAGFSFIASASAQTAYPAQLAADFTDWCSAKQGQSTSVCSCALDGVTTQIPAAAMASFLAAPEGAAMASVSSGAGLTAVQVVTTCASGASPAAGAAIGAAGALGAGLLGR